MSNQELLECVKGLGKHPSVLNVFMKNHHEGILNEIILRTHFLDDGFYVGKSVPIMARLYCLEHDIKEHPRC